MRRAGRAHLIVILGLVGAVAAVALFLSGDESPRFAANRFLTSLLHGDVDTLVEMTYYPDKSKDEIRKQWEYATQVAGKHYLFAWKITTENKASEDRAAVRMFLYRNSETTDSYEEKYGLPMVRQDGKWLVDVQNMPRILYPALPR